MEPKIVFTTNSLDLGRVIAGNQAGGSFIFTNAGQRQLEIKEVRPSCGCTTAGDWSRRVEPGASGTIPIRFNSANAVGPISKTIQVSCNDPVQPTVTLLLKADVWKPVEIIPAQVVFNFSAGADSNSVKVVQITNKMEGPLELSPPELASSNFQAMLKTIEPGKAFELAIRPVTIPPRGGPLQFPVTMRTTSTNLPILTVNVIAVVPPSIEVLPAEIVLPRTPSAMPSPVTVTIRNNESAPVALSSPQVSVPGVQVRLHEPEPGHLFKVALTFPPEFRLSPGQAAKLTIKTSDLKHPELVIPIAEPNSRLPKWPGMPSMEESDQPPGQTVSKRAQPVTSSALVPPAPDSHSGPIGLPALHPKPLSR